MYVTTAQLADRPGARELAQVATPERLPIVADALFDAVLRGQDTTGFDPQDVANAGEALAVVEQAIGDAGGIIDGYLARRYPVPLAPVPGVVTAWARAIARYLLHKDRRSVESDDPILRDYRDAQKLLQLTADGKFSLGADDPELNDPANSGAAFITGSKLFGRGARG
jgi:phage gp36-like protein